MQTTGNDLRRQIQMPAKNGAITPLYIGFRFANIYLIFNIVSHFLGGFPIMLGRESP